MSETPTVTSTKLSQNICEIIWGEKKKERVLLERQEISVVTLYVE